MRLVSRDCISAVLPVHYCLSMPAALLCLGAPNPISYIFLPNFFTSLYVPHHFWGSRERSSAVDCIPVCRGWGEEGSDAPRKMGHKDMGKLADLPAVWIGHEGNKEDMAAF